MMRDFVPTGRQRRERDGAPRFALPMYQRMGFARWSDAPAIHGVPYAICLKDLPTIDPSQIFTNSN